MTYYFGLIFLKVCSIMPNLSLLPGLATLESFFFFLFFFIFLVAMPRVSQNWVNNGVKNMKLSCNEHDKVTKHDTIVQQFR